jgi:putative membrane protein
MMYWYGNSIGGWGYALMGLGTVISWAVMITAIVLLVRFLARANRSTPPTLSVSPEELLAQRYARGEMDDVEYRHRLETLRIETYTPTIDR